MDRSSKMILRRVVIDVLCLLVVSLAVLLFYLFGKPYRRGFFCNDESLYHPFHPSTITSTMLYVIGLFLPICAMTVGEYMHGKNIPDAPRTFLGYTIPPWVWNAYEKIGIFGFGAATNVLITDVGKYSIGKLRPHFMSVCVPNVNCSYPENQHRYIEDFICTASNASARMLKDVRLSFPSGHSSFSAYTMIYLVIYLQLRMTWKGSKLLRHVLQLTCFLMAWFTAMSRISDYKHHWSDVLAGSIIGVIVAIVMTIIVADFFAERRTRSASEKQRQNDYEIEGGTQDESRPLRTRVQPYGGVEGNSEDTR